MKKDNLKNPVSKMGNFITSRNLAVFLTGTYIISLIPLFLLSGYVYPCADDYTFGSRCNFVWEDTHSIILVIKQAFLAAVWYYKNWAGCFSSSFFMVLQPAIWGERFYAITPFLMLGIMSLGTLYFLHVLFTKCLKCDGWHVQSIAMILLLTVVQCNMGAVEAYFWYNGAAHYTLMYGFSMFLYGTMLSLVLEKKTGRRIVYAVVAGILAIIVGGGNYLTALNAAILFVFLWGWLGLCKTTKEHKLEWIPTILLIVSFLASVLAPGNSVRAAESAGWSPVKAIVVSFYYTFNYAMSDWMNWFVLLSFMLIAIVFWFAAEKIEFDFPYPLVVVGLSFCVVSAAITPCLYGMGNIEGARIQAVIFTMYMLFLTISVCYCTGWLKKQLQKKYSIKGSGNFTLNGKIAIISCLLFLFAGYVITVVPELETFTTSEAVRELLSGEAKAYGDAMKERGILYRSGEKNLVVPKLPVNPPLLFASDLKEDPDDWENQGVCRFFELESVRVEKREETTK